MHSDDSRRPYGHGEKVVEAADAAAKALAGEASDHEATQPANDTDSPRDDNAEKSGAEDHSPANSDTDTDLIDPEGGPHA